MTGRPWMPFYIGDYLADTQHLNNAEHGSYMLLILHYWQHGGLPNDENQLLAIARTPPQNWPQIREVISRFFHHGWRHKRIDREITRFEDISAKRKIASQKAHAARYGTQSGKRSAKTLPNPPAKRSANHNHNNKHTDSSEHPAPQQEGASEKEDGLQISPQLAALVRRQTGGK